MTVPGSPGMGRISLKFQTRQYARLFTPAITEDLNVANIRFVFFAGLDACGYLFIMLRHWNPSDSLGG